MDLLSVSTDVVGGQPPAPPTSVPTAQRSSTNRSSLAGNVDAIDELHAECTADGAIVEELASGLRLRVSPMAFFQASTRAAESLFATVVEMATDGGAAFPACVLDLCCGGGVLGLEAALGRVSVIKVEE